MGAGFLADVKQALQTSSSFYLDQYNISTTTPSTNPHLSIMDLKTNSYPMPNGCRPIPANHLDPRTDTQIDQDFLIPHPITSPKNFWGFYSTGFTDMPPHYQRNVRTWSRRLSPLGWTVRILDRVPGSPLHVSNFLDTANPEIFPKAFIDGQVGGDFSPQHVSDLVRFPLLLKYGGMYADVGCMLIGNLDTLWASTIGDPESGIEVLGFNAGGLGERSLTNYFMGALPGNAYFQRSHELLVQGLWNSGGGRNTTEGMHRHPLLKGVPLMGAGSGFEIKNEDGEVVYGEEEVSRLLTDYIIQGQAMGQVAGLIDNETAWNGPEYWAKKVYAIDYLQYSQLMNVFTQWSGQRAFELMSLPLPKEGEQESEDQKLARRVVEAHLEGSFVVKLAQGFITRVLGDTLGSLWAMNEGSDCVEGTYAGWLRWGMGNWCQEGVPPKMEFEVLPATKVGPLLRDE